MKTSNRGIGASTVLSVFEGAQTAPKVSFEGSLFSCLQITSKVIWPQNLLLIARSLRLCALHQARHRLLREQSLLME